MSRLILVLIACLLIAGLAQSSERLTYVDLVGRMVDLERLATLPEPGEECAQWSSYDRASRYDEATGKYVHWDANGDGGGIIRKEDGKNVFAEIEGPGCIWRIWSAAADNGHVRIYLDGKSEPAVDLPFRGYFNRENEPFNYESLVYISSRGHNNYVPIPFQKSCKIVADDGWGNYYHFTYSKFPEGTIVPTFTRELSTADKAALKSVDEYFRTRLGSDPVVNRDLQFTIKRTVYVPAGQTVRAARLTQRRAVTAIRVKPRTGSVEDIGRALRSVALQITWDNQEKPAVWCPIGDFFGTGPGINQYKSFVTGMTDEMFYSYWYMPFQKKGIVEFVNDGTEGFSFDLELSHAPHDIPADQMAYFHAKWHRDAFLPKEPERWIDWTMITTEGRGRYCGVMLEVWNPEGGWWGEGDEKFHVDGEKFPSTIGTGSEDYFGYAWCNPELFQKPFHNQTICENSNKGHVSVNRFHVGDNVPFQESFEGYIEKYYPNDKPTRYACTAYWYLNSGDSNAVDPYDPVPIEDRFFYEPE